MLYLISYDLDKPGQDYKGVISCLQQLGAMRVLLSVWLLESAEESSEKIRQSIEANARLDKTDRFLVTEVNYNAAWRNLLAKGDEVLALYKRAARSC